MDIKIEKSRLSGAVSAPPSKSAAHRMLICAALAGNGAAVEGVAFSEDIMATLNCLSALGINYKVQGDRIEFTGEEKSESAHTHGVFNCNESGSTLRFFIPIVLAKKKYGEFMGSERLMSRPLSVYEEIFKEREIEFIKRDESLFVKGELGGGEYFIKGNISSQFITGMLFALPLVGGGTVNVIPPVESRPYIEMTLDAMETFGIKVERSGKNSYTVSGDYRKKTVKVEGDYSNAAFLEAFNLIGGNVTVEGLSPDSLQGDRVFYEYFERIKSGYCTLDISATPDLGPILMAVAAAFEGVELTGCSRLKIKESDRGEVMKAVLGEFSVPVEVLGDRIIVKGGCLIPPAKPIYGYNDHRIVMSEAFLLSITGGEIIGGDAVRKSYPDFFERMRELGMKTEIIN